MQSIKSVQKVKKNDSCIFSFLIFLHALSMVNQTVTDDSYFKPV